MKCGYSWCLTGIPSDGIFNSYQTTIIDSFSCILSLWQLHLALNMLFYQFHARITFSSKNCSVWLLSKKLMSKSLVPVKSKMMLKSVSWRHARGRLRIRWKYPEKVKNLVRYARNFYSTYKTLDCNMTILPVTQKILMPFLWHISLLTFFN